MIPSHPLDDPLETSEHCILSEKIEGTRWHPEHGDGRFKSVTRNLSLGHGLMDSRDGQKSSKKLIRGSLWGEFLCGWQEEGKGRERRRDTPGVRGRGTTLYRFTVES